MNTKILVIEDDPHISLGLQEILTRDGYHVTVCPRGDQALATITRAEPSLIILDIMLPGANGFDICRQLRAKNITIPILMLTAKGQEMDKVIGLDSGADDYLTKPFGLRELLSRVHALLRRAQPSLTPDHATFSVGEATVDGRRFELRRGDTVHQLTPRELKLLQYFHAHRGEALSRDQLLNHVWGYGYYGTTRTLDQVIVQLRRKLGDSGATPKHLLTVHGVGYKLVP